MRVEVFRVTGNAVELVVGENGTVRDVLSHPDSGQVVGQEGSLLDYAEREYGSVQGLGTLRVNGAPATLDTPVSEGATSSATRRPQGVSRHPRERGCHPPHHPQGGRRLLRTLAG